MLARALSLAPTWRGGVCSARTAARRAFVTHEYKSSGAEVDRSVEELNAEFDTLFGAGEGAARADQAASPFLAKEAGVRSGQSSAEVSRLTHVGDGGAAHMVDIAHKADTKRTAVAVASVAVGPTVGSLIRANLVQKGDVLSVARLAGIMAAKLTPQLIPLCHPILLSSAHVELQLDERAEVVDVQATASSVGGTGVEMEAMVAAAVAALTVYDMCKAASKHIVISQVKLRSKTGGKSGDWHRDE